MDKTVVVLGSGPIRIGQGIEFDYSCVHCVWALQELGYRAVIINNNPETVSTDFDTGNALYFEPVTLESVLRIVEHEKAFGVVVQFGGQTAINLAQGLTDAGVTVLGTPASAIAAAEDRDLFDQVLNRLGIAKPSGKAVRTLHEATEVAREIGYPVLVRPSFVLGGRAMDIVYSEAYLEQFFAEAERANPGQPILVDKYFLGTEAEVDVISDGESTLVPGIMEHIERAGIHSGDSMAVYPPVSLSCEIQSRMAEIAIKIAKELGVRGLMNIQFVIQGSDVMVIEVNPRASRTVPYLSKVSGVPMIKLATGAMMGRTLAELGYGSGIWCQNRELELGGIAVSPEQYSQGNDLQANLFAVKAPVFSFQKLAKVEPSLGPEMKSTGEVLGIDFTYEAALYKALIASGVNFKAKGQVIISVSDGDKKKVAELAKVFHQNGYELASTAGTHAEILAAGVPCEKLNKIKEGSPNLLERLFEGRVSLMINTPGPAHTASADAARIRRACIETGIACITSIDTAVALARSLSVFENPHLASCLTVSEYLQGNLKPAASHTGMVS